jgi:hypothetical protein
MLLPEGPGAEEARHCCVVAALALGVLGCDLKILGPNARAIEHRYRFSGQAEPIT